MKNIWVDKGGISVSRKINWLDLEDGDVFQIPVTTTTFQDRVGIYSGSLTTMTTLLYEIKAGYIHRLGDPQRIVLLPNRPNGNFSLMGLKQSVLVLEASEILPEHYITNTGPRVNSCTGSDPEIFVVRGKDKKTLLPAFQYLPKQEEQKKKHTDRNIGNISSECMSYPYRDGFAAECYIHPVHCHGYLINYLRNGLDRVREAARAYDRTATLSIKNTFTIPSITMANATDEDVALGCTPSLNAYGDSPELPASGKDFRLRFAGGHVHFGIDSLKDDLAAEMVRTCDVVAAIPAVAIFASLDTPVRRQYYGRAGEYRKPKYGLEYRVLSNAWLASPEVAHLMLNLVRSGLKIGKAGYRKYLDIGEQEARDIINFCDVEAARKYVMKHSSLFQKILYTDGVRLEDKHHKVFETIIQGGIEAVVPTFQDVERNWLLDSNWAGESNNHTATWGHLCRRPSQA
jgi:Phage phiEco32-like COOH.NH2 ligase-type 2